MKVQCVACLGIYDTGAADGIGYYHVCPLLSDAEVGRALGLADNSALWTKAQRDQVDAAPRVRAGARDENIDPAKADAAAATGARKAAVFDPTSLQKSPGAGARPV